MKVKWNVNPVEIEFDDEFELGENSYEIRCPICQEDLDDYDDVCPQCGADLVDLDVGN